ncbi:MAG: hypothetical protein WCK86_17625 [Planctomycetia bacterium]
MHLQESGGHGILRRRHDVVATSSENKAARKWWMLCPARKNQDGSPTEQTQVQHKAIGNDRRGLKETGAKAAGRAGEYDTARRGSKQHTDRWIAPTIHAPRIPRRRTCCFQAVPYSRPGLRDKQLLKHSRQENQEINAVAGLIFHCARQDGTGWDRMGQDGTGQAGDSASEGWQQTASGKQRADHRKRRPTHGH